MKWIMGRLYCQVKVKFSNLYSASESKYLIGPSFFCSTVLTTLHSSRDILLANSKARNWLSTSLSTTPPNQSPNQIKLTIQRWLHGGLQFLDTTMKTVKKLRNLFRLRCLMICDSSRDSSWINRTESRIDISKPSSGPSVCPTVWRSGGRRPR